MYSCYHLRHAVLAHTEIQMQTNHLSHFLLTKELFPLLNKKANAVGEARIVNHSSMAAVMGGPFEDKYASKSDDGWGGDGTEEFSPTNPRSVRYHHSKVNDMLA